MSYTGGKGGPGVWQKIISQMPPHTLYIEAFLGAGSVLRHKRPAVATIAIERDAAVIERLWRGDEIAGLRVVHAEALQWLACYAWRGDEVLYCDPPYLMSTRSTQRAYYANEFATEPEHRRLLALLKQVPARVLLSGYWSELYAAELADWRSLSFTTGTRGGGKAVEWLWCNFAEPVELHDYRYMGSGFRERERITRQQKRWARKLARMSTLQRRALLWALQAQPAGSIATTGETGQSGAPSPEPAGLPAGIAITGGASCSFRAPSPEPAIQDPK